MTKQLIETNKVRDSDSVYFLEIINKILVDAAEKLGPEKFKKFAADDLLPYSIAYIKENFDLSEVDLYEILKMEYKAKEGGSNIGEESYLFTTMQSALYYVKSQQNNDLIDAYNAQIGIDNKLLLSIISQSEKCLKLLDSLSHDNNNRLTYEAIINARRCLLNQNSFYNKNIHDFNDNICLLQSASPDVITVIDLNILLLRAMSQQLQINDVIDGFSKILSRNGQEESKVKLRLNAVLQSSYSYLESLFNKIQNQNTPEIEKEQALGRFMVIHEARSQLFRNGTDPRENLKNFFKVITDNSAILLLDKSISAILFFKAINLLVTLCLNIGIKDAFVYRKLFQPLIKFNMKFFQDALSGAAEKKDLDPDPVNITNSN